MDIPEELVESCQRGDPEAFEELVRLTHRASYSLAFRIAGSAEDAADITQDAYVRAWKSIKSFRGDAKFSSWLYRIVSNTAFTHVKRRNRSGEPVDPQELPELPSPDVMAQADDAAALEQALGTLPPQHRAVVIMKDMYGMTCQEIGKELGATEGAIKVRLFRARQRLADQLVAGGVVIPMSKRKRTS